MFLPFASPTLPSEVSLLLQPTQGSVPLAHQPSTLFEGVLELFDKLLKAVEILYPRSGQQRRAIVQRRRKSSSRRRESS
jgi:hypothetical protein